MPRQIRRDHCKIRCEQRRQITPAMRGRGRTMQQQKARPLPHALYMPAKPAGFDKLARFPIGPIAPVSFPVWRFNWRSHGINAQPLAGGPPGAPQLTCARHPQKAAARTAHPWRKRGRVKTAVAAAQCQ